MAESQVLTAARKLITDLDAWEGPNDDWRRFESREKTARVEDFMRVWRWLADQVIDANGRVLPVTAPQTTKYFVQTADDLTAIGRFDLANANAQQEFRQRHSSIERQLHEVLNETGVWACQHSVRRADKPTGKVVELLAEAEQKLQRIDEYERDAKAARESAKGAAAKAGAAVFTDSFKASAARDQRASRTWLCAGASLMALTVLLASLFAFGLLSNPSEGWESLVPLTGRLFLLTILTYGTVWCGRRALAERHNSRVNEHRANSIRTIQAFRESANAEPTKDAVVLEAARAIFENVETGDLGTSPDRPSIAKTIEIFRPLGSERQ